MLKFVIVPLTTCSFRFYAQTGPLWEIWDRQQQEQHLEQQWEVGKQQRQAKQQSGRNEQP
jgi:hypothetical protein